VPSSPPSQAGAEELEAGAPAVPPVEAAESTGAAAPGTREAAPSSTSAPWPARESGYGAHAAEGAPQGPGPRRVPSTPPAVAPGELGDQPPAGTAPSAAQRAPETDPLFGPLPGSRFSEPQTGPIPIPTIDPATGSISRPVPGPIPEQAGEAPPAERPSGAAAREGATTWELMRDQLRASNLTPVRKIPPSRGWRKWLYSASLGRINPGESPDELRLRALNETVDTPLRGTYSVVVLGGKGGAGKTTMAAVIGSTLALLRNDKVVAIDADSAQAANLASRIDPRSSSSFSEVIADYQLSRYSDMRSHVGQNAVGLDVLAASPAGRGPVDAPAYTEAHRRLERFYSLLIADCGVDLQHPVASGVLDCADAVVLVASAAPDGAEGAAKVMDWLSEMGYWRLASRMLVVINHIRPFSGQRDKTQSRQLVATLVERFGDWVGPENVFVVPFDPHIANADVLDLDQLRPQTRRRFLEITAQLASGFAATTEGRR